MNFGSVIRVGIVSKSVALLALVVVLGCLRLLCLHSHALIYSVFYEGMFVLYSMPAILGQGNLLAAMIAKGFEVINISSLLHISLLGVHV